MSDIWANAYNSQQKNLENSQSNVWDRQAQVVEQQEAARLENRKKYGVDLTDEEYAQINNLIADSENQEEEAHKIGSAIMMSKQLGIPVDEAYTKVDDYQASLFSPEKVTNYRSGFTAIKDMLVMGSNNVRIGQIGNQIRKAQKRGDQEEVEILMQEYKALQEDNALRYDNAPRNWVTRVLKDGAQSLPYTAYSAGAAMLGSFIAPVAGTLAAFGTSSYLMAGQEYLDMLDRGIRPEIADRVSIISGASQGLVETALGEVMSWAGSGAHLLGNKVIGKELRNKLTDSIAESLQRKFHFGAGSKVAAKVISDYLLDLPEEGAEEFVQQEFSENLQNYAVNKENAARKKDAQSAVELERIAGNITDQVADDLIKAISEQMPELDTIPQKEIFKDSLEAFKGGVMGAIALGIVPLATNSVATARDYKKTRDFVKETPSEAMVQQFLDNDPAGQKVKESFNEKQQETLAHDLYEQFNSERDAAENLKAKEISEVNSAADTFEEIETDEETGESNAAPVYRNENGELETSQETISQEGNVTTKRYNVFDPTKEGANVYGYLESEIDEDNDTVTIKTFDVNNAREGLRQEIFENFARDYAGYKIVWDAVGERAQNIKQELISNNPSGAMNELSYYSSYDEVADIKGRKEYAAKLKSVYKGNYTQNQLVQHVALGEALYNNLKKHGDIDDANFGEFINRLDIKGAKSQFAKGGFYTPDFEKNAKATIYVTQNGNFTTAVHEFAHFYRSLLQGEHLAEVSKAFGVKQNEDGTYEWKREDDERLAYGLENYLATGKAESAEQKKWYEKLCEFMADAMKRLHRAVKFTPEIEKVYQDMLDSGNKGVLAAAYRAVEEQQKNETNARKAEQQKKEAQQKQQQEKEQRAQTKEEQRANVDISAETTEANSQEFPLNPAEEAQIREERLAEDITREDITQTLADQGLSEETAKEVAEVLTDETATQVEKVEAALDAAAEVIEELPEDGLFQLEVVTKERDAIEANVYDSLTNIQKERIDKIVNSPNYVIDSDAYIGHYELEKKSISDYLKSLPEITNKDTGDSFDLSKAGRQKLLSHSLSNENYLKSIYHLPQLLGNAIFLGELPNLHPQRGYPKYRYYITGFNMDGTDYTVRYAVGLNTNGKWIYDEQLTQIEKGELLSREANSVSKNALSNKDDIAFIEKLQDILIGDTSKLEAPEDTLYGVHNLSEEAIKHVFKMGGLANPSLAVMDKEKGVHTNFGSISLIAYNSLINKSTGKNSGTYGADVYSPRYPNITKTVMVTPKFSTLDFGTSFAAAVLPENTDPAVIGKLEEQGLLIYKYKDSNDREAVTKKALELANQSRNILFQTQDELYADAMMFETWQEFMEAYTTDFNPEALEDPDYHNQVPSDADAQWYQTTWELAHNIKPEESLNAEEQAAIVASDDTTAAALDAMFSTRMASDEAMLDDFLVRVAEIEEIDLNSPEYSRPQNEEEEAELKNIERLQDFIETQLNHGNWISNAKRVRNGNELTTTARKRIVSLIRSAPRDYRAIYAEIMGDQQYAVEEKDTVAAQLASKAKLTKYKAASPDSDFERMSPEKRRKIAEDMQNEDIARRIKSGKLTMDDEIEQYIRSLNNQIKERDKELESLEKETREDYQSIADWQKRRLLELNEKLQLAKNNLDRKNTEVERLIAKGQKISGKYQKDVQNMRADYNEIFRKFNDLKDTIAIDVQVEEALKRQVRVYKAKEEIREKNAEKAKAQEIKDMRIKLVKRTMRRVPFNRIDYDNAKTIIAVQRMLEPNLLGGVNRWIGVDSPYLRGVVSSIITDSDKKDNIINYLKKTSRKSEANRKLIERIENLKSISDFEKWTKKEAEYAIKKLPKENWVKELNLEKLAEEREDSIDLDIDMKEKQRPARDPKTGEIRTNKDGQVITEATWELTYSPEIARMVSDAIGADMFNKLINLPFAEWTTEDLEKLAVRINELYTEGRDLLEAKKRAKIEAADQIRRAIEDTVKDTGIVINDDDSPEEKERKQKKINKILGFDSTIKGTQHANVNKESRINRLLHGFVDANVRRVARILDNYSEGTNTNELYWKENEAYKAKTKSMNSRAVGINKVLKSKGITSGDLAKEVNILDRVFTVDELLYIIAADKDYVAKEDKEGSSLIDDNDDFAATSRNAVMFGNILSETENTEWKEKLAEQDKAMLDRINNGTLSTEEQQALTLGQLDKHPGLSQYINAAHGKYEAVIAAANSFLKENPKYNALLEAISNDYADQYDRMNEISIQEFNQPVHRTKAYVPLVRMESNGDTNDNRVREDLLATMGGNAKSWVNKGMTQRRVNMNPLNQKPVQMGLYKTWADSVERTEHFIAYAGYVRELNRVYKSRDAAYTRQFIESRYGKGMVRYIDDYINEVANPNANRQRSAADELMHTLRGKTAPAYLAWKASSVMKQAATSPWPYMQFVNPVTYLNACMKCLKPGTYKAIREKSVFMNNRRFDPLADLVDEMDEKSQNGFEKFMA